MLSQNTLINAIFQSSARSIFKSLLFFLLSLGATAKKTKFAFVPKCSKFIHSHCTKFSFIEMFDHKYLVYERCDILCDFK